jgi:hypothetical protein
VLDAQLLSLGGRVKRITQAEQTADPTGGEKLVRDLLATRLPIDLPPMMSGPLAPSASTAVTYSGVSLVMIAAVFLSNINGSDASDPY